jgi:O-antigen/teichoic acid export membrane protein
MLNKLIDFIKRPTNVHILINTIGNYLGVFFTALFALILVRILEPSQYGVLSVLLGIAYVLSNILDFGTTATIYSFLPPMIERKANNIYRFIKSTFFYQSFFSFIIIGILFISFPYLDKVFFKTRAPIWELYLTAVSVLFLIWQNFVTNILFAAKKFLKANIYSNLANLFKTIIILFLVYLKMITVGSIIFVFGIVGPIIFFLLLFIEKKDYVFVLIKSKIDIKEFRFKYTLTYFVASQFFNMGLRMDLFLLSYFLSKREVGYYGLAQKIILTIITTIVSITQVLSPGFSKIKTKKEVKKQIWHGLLYMLLPCALFILLVLTPNFVFTLFFTDKFINTAAITKSLSLPFIIYALGSIPQLFILYTVKKPRYILVANIVLFLIISIGCYYLIPIMGVKGPPYAIAIALVTATIILIIASVKEYAKLPT